MYTTKNRLNGDDTCTPPAIVSKSVDSVESVIGARSYGYRGEPFYISKMARKCGIRGCEKTLDHPTGYLEDNSHLCNTMTCITVRLEQTLYL